MTREKAAKIAAWLDAEMKRLGFHDAVEKALREHMLYGTPLEPQFRRIKADIERRLQTEKYGSN